MSGSDVKASFDATASGYDRARRQLVPDFDGFYGTLVGELSLSRGWDEEFRVLDLGAGTGLSSALVSEAFPRARFTLVDASEKMLSRAEERFAYEPLAKEHFELRVLDFAEEPLPEVPGGYEVVISALAIHHLSGEDKKELFGKVYGVLADGGVFVNGDQVLGPTPELEERYGEVWLQQVRENGVTEKDSADARCRMQEDRQDTLEEQLVWLKEAGFEQVDCAYKNYRFAVYGGRKPSYGQERN